MNECESYASVTFFLYENIFHGKEMYFMLKKKKAPGQRKYYEHFVGEAL